MKSRYASLNIKMQWADKRALINYAMSQGESVSVVVRKMIKDELISKGFLQPANNKEVNNE